MTPDGDPPKEDGEIAASRAAAALLPARCNQGRSSFRPAPGGR